MTTIVSEYEETVERIARLNRRQKMDLLAEIVNQLREEGNEPEHDIMELEGLGKEIWEGVDAQEYINQERDSWDG